VSHRRREEIKKFQEFNESENTIYENLWDVTKAVLKGKITAVNIYIKNTEHK
jgi:hypothetical protein